MSDSLQAHPPPPDGGKAGRSCFGPAGQRDSLCVAALVESVTNFGGRPGSAKTPYHRGGFSRRVLGSVRSLPVFFEAPPRSLHRGGVSRVEDEVGWGRCVTLSPETARDLRAMVLPVDDHVEENLM